MGNHYRNISTAPGSERDFYPRGPGAALFFEAAELRIVERRAAVPLAVRMPPTIGLLVAGWATRERRLPGGRRVILSIYLPGDLIGTDRLFPDQSPDSIVALTEAGYRSLEGAKIDEGLRQHPDLAMLLLRHQAAEQEECRRHIARLAGLPAQRRTADALSRLCERLTLQESELAGGGAPAPRRLPLTRQDLADYLGLPVVGVNRALGALQAAGAVELQDESVLVANADRLQVIAAAPVED